MKTRISLLILFASAAFGQSAFTIADDSSSGTYKRMLGEIVNVCSNDDLDIREAQGVSGGAPGNLDALVNNRAQAAFLHSDVFFANAQADPSYKKFQTLVALYPEPIHVLALRVSKTKKQGTFAFGTVDFNSLSEMAGFKVGASGGGVFTARILQGQGQGGFTVVPFGSGSDLISALENGDVAAAIFVGGAPLPNIEKLNKQQFKLLPVGEAIAGRVQGVYRPTSINYNGLTNGPLKTLAPVATLITRKYSTPVMVAVQRKFRDCFNKQLPALQDSGAPSWQQVEPNDHGVLDWYEIPGSVVATGRGRGK